MKIVTHPLKVWTTPWNTGRHRCNRTIDVAGCSGAGRSALKCSSKTYNRGSVEAARRQSPCLRLSFRAPRRARSPSSSTNQGVNKLRPVHLRFRPSRKGRRQRRARACIDWTSGGKRRSARRSPSGDCWICYEYTLDNITNVHNEILVQSAVCDT